MSTSHCMGPVPKEGEHFCSNCQFIWASKSNKPPERCPQCLVDLKVIEKAYEEEKDSSEELTWEEQRENLEKTFFAHPGMAVIDLLDAAYLCGLDGRMLEKEYQRGRRSVIEETKEKLLNRIDEKHFEVCPGCDLCEHRMGKNDAYREVIELLTASLTSVLTEEK